MYGVACVVEYAQRACPVGTHPSWRRLLALLTQPSDFRRALGLLPRALAFVDTATRVSSAASGDGTSANGCSVVMNSVLTGGELGAGVVVEHSVLSGTWQVGDGCLCSGIRDGTLRDASLSPHTAVQEVRLAGEAKRVLTLHGTRDSIKRGPAHDGSTVCGVSWSRNGTSVACHPLQGIHPARSNSTQSRKRLDAMKDRSFLSAKKKTALLLYDISDFPIFPAHAGLRLRVHLVPLQRPESGRWGHAPAWRGSYH